MPFSRLAWYNIAIFSFCLMITTGCGISTTDNDIPSDKSQRNSPGSSTVPTAYDNRTHRPNTAPPTAPAAAPHTTTTKSVTILGPWNDTAPRIPLPGQSQRLKDLIAPKASNRSIASPSKTDYIAHEWGTYTSVQSSEGKLLDGLQHEEESLPNFVHKRGQMMKGLESIMGHIVNQKLETPVIYFYAKNQMKVQVDVSFPKGIISEWYPNATAFQPKIGYFDGYQATTSPENGSMQWQVELVPGLQTAPRKVDPDNIWAPSREVPAATPVRFAPYQNYAEVEKFIFYRGVGRFQGWFQVKASQDGMIHLHNQSTSAVAKVYVLRVEGNKGAILDVGSMKADTQQTIQPPQVLEDMDTYIDRATRMMAADLEKTGLYRDEAWSMVNTWRRSYFKSQTSGVRVLYIVPRKDTDALLPITFSPAPQELVRTLVGRIEVLTPQAEAQTLSLLRSAYQSQRTPDLSRYGRFVEAKLRRAAQQIADPALHAFCQELIQRTFRMHGI